MLKNKYFVVYMKIDTNTYFLSLSFFISHWFVFDVCYFISKCICFVPIRLCVFFSCVSLFFHPRAYKHTQAIKQWEWAINIKCFEQNIILNSSTPWQTMSFLAIYLSKKLLICDCEYQLKFFELWASSSIYFFQVFRRLNSSYNNNNDVHVYTRVRFNKILRTYVTIISI